MGYTAVEYWNDRSGFPSLAQLAKHPKSLSDFGAALQGVTGLTLEQFEAAYLAALRPKIDQPPPSIRVTVHLEAGGITPQTYIYFNSYYGVVQGYRTPSLLAAGDYAFEIASDGSVRSSDGKTTLTPFSLTLTESSRGQGHVVINHPAYRGQTGEDGREVLGLLATHGRAGLTGRWYAINHATGTSAAQARLPQELEESDGSHPAQFPAGDCLAPWPDGNRIVAQVAQTTPVLGGPPNGSTLSALEAELAWDPASRDRLGPGAGDPNQQRQPRRERHSGGHPGGAGGPAAPGGAGTGPGPLSPTAGDELLLAGAGHLLRRAHRRKQPPVGFMGARQEL